MTRRLLLVEPSATMRHVLETHVRARGHEVESSASYATALDALQHQYSAFESDIACVLYGWPSLPDAAADALSARLESADFEDLPVVVMSTDMRAETRAWVAGRERTAVLSWKDYLGIDALLERLVDDSGHDQTARVPKFDNADINVLVVDDSPTIRHSLRELFELQGYRVGVAATREEALAATRRERFDIAVLDFYLEESTGDALCRELVSDPACGGVICAILTGTYADHVIKRSLRAGAVECMFKNESSELLLTRIDAIARSVRQRRELDVGMRRLERVVDALGGSLLVIDEASRVRHASAQALSDLALSPEESLDGRSVRELLEVDELPAPGTQRQTMRWRGGDGRWMTVSAAHAVLPGGAESLLGFERLDVDELPQDSGVAAIVQSFGLPATGAPFVEELARRLDEVGTRSGRSSLLLIGLFETLEDGTHAAVSATGVLLPRIERGLKRLFRREEHVAALGGHRFGLLVRHDEEPQAYLLTRRLMQLANRLLIDDEGPLLASTGCLVGLSAHAASGAGAVLRHAFAGLGVVEARGVDQALLLGPRRMLTVYPRTSDASGAASSVSVSPESAASPNREAAETGD